MVVHASNSSFQEVEAGRPRVQGQCWLHSELEVSLNKNKTEKVRKTLGDNLAQSSGLMKIWYEYLYLEIKRVRSEATQLVNGQGRIKSHVLIFGTCYLQLIKK